MAVELTLPRSAVLAAWLGCGGPWRRVLDGVQGDDEPHTVRGAGTGPTLTHLLVSLAAGDVTVPPVPAACVLPVPGDPGGLGPEVAPAAVQAGEAVLVVGPDGPVALVPTVTRFGSDLEPGHQVAWQVRPVPDWRAAVLARAGTPGDADRTLTTALREATAALVELDVAHWPAERAAQVVAARDGALPSGRLPALSGPRARTLASAARLRALVEVARGDHAATPTAGLADRRSAALRDVDSAARAAMAAATTFVTV